MKPFVILILTASLTFAATRYVSNEGSDTVPYTSWETASPDLQKVIDYCEPWDTVLIAKGDYFGTFDVLKNLVIIGENRDSTRIYYSDSSGINQDRALIYGTDSLVIKNISLYGAAECNYGVSMYKEFSPEINLILEDSEIKHCLECIDVYEGSLVLRRNNLWNVRNNVLLAVFVTNNFPNYHTAVVENNVFYLKALAMQSGVNRTVFNNNIIIGADINAQGLSFLWSRDYVEIKNNIFQSSSLYAAYIENIDTVIVGNNTFVPNYSYSVFVSGKGIYINQSDYCKVYNNIFYQVNRAIRKSGTGNPAVATNNLFYGTLLSHISGNVSLLEGNIFEVDPMFRDDSFWDQSAWDVQLQYASPAIDAGVPELFDVDGTRSDMGAFGGSGGISYQYVDLSPKAVKLDTIYYVSDSAKVKMKWKHNTESDLMGYFIYRDTTENFMPSAENEKCFLTENSYEAIIGDIQSPVLYYKILAIDSAKNKSEIDSVYKIVRGDTVTTFINRFERNYDFQLGQNYPNPFNPETTITYEMKQEGAVSIKVYDIKGEYISTIENAQKSKGKHIIKFNGDNLASGIYLYRIEVTGANRTPLYQDMKKMILVK